MKESVLPEMMAATAAVTPDQVRVVAFDICGRIHYSFTDQLGDTGSVGVEGLNDAVSDRFFCRLPGGRLDRPPRVAFNP
jgi:hypothetical protein